MNVLNRLLSFLSAIRTDLTFDSLVESFHGKVKLCTITLDKLMLYYFTVINKDLTTEEVERVEDLVTYLEGQNSVTGLEKQVLLLCRFTTSHVRILLIVVVVEHAVISYFINPLSGHEFNLYFCAIFFCNLKHGFCLNWKFSLDTTKIQTTNLLILLRFYFHGL